MIVYLINLIFLIQSALALTASSENYSVSMFGTGIQATNLASDNYSESHSVLLASGGGRHKAHYIGELSDFSENPEAQPLCLMKLQLVKPQ